MAMTLRLPEELDRQLAAVAAARGTSKHALVVEGTAMIVAIETQTERATTIAAGVRDRYAELMRRLEDA